MQTGKKHKNNYDSGALFLHFFGVSSSVAFSGMNTKLSLEYWNTPLMNYYGIQIGQVVTIASYSRYSYTFLDSVYVY